MSKSIGSGIIISDGQSEEGIEMEDKGSGPLRASPPHRIVRIRSQESGQNKIFS